MTRHELTKFYNDNVCKVANRIVELKKEQFRFTPNADAFYEEYLSLKALIKKNDGPGANNVSDKLDRHKRSACMAAALLKLRQICNMSQEDKTDDLDFITLSARSNAQLAVFAGLQNLACYMVYDGIIGGVAAFPDNTGLIFPENTNEKDNVNGNTYIDSLVRGLFYTEWANVGNINLLLLSNIFFLLEQYHLQALKLQKLQPITTAT